MTVKFHYLVRGILRVNGKLLLVHQIGADNTFLLGGHIEEGERVEDALVREIEEEIGRRAVIRRFIGAVEHAWPAANADNHEINLLFEINVPELDSESPPQSCGTIWNSSGRN